MTQLLNQALHGYGEVVQEKPSDQDDRSTLTVVLLLRAGDLILGAMLANSQPLTELEMQEVSLLLRTFAQSLSALWRNLILFEETNQRSLEMEILYGRYVDSIWHTDSAHLHARQDQNQFQLIRHRVEPPETPNVLPVQISDYPIGQVYLPDDTHLTDEQLEYAQVIVREMGNALNNAYLLQTTRSTSNQLNLATEVSRAATTILDRDLLMKEVVELIRARFGFYYVGLFLVDEKSETAVLHAGTGEAGRLQLERHHHQVVGGSSMVGVSIAQNTAIVEQDVTQAKAFKYNPLLPDTRSELALPLRSRGQVIGALTVQSTEQAIFTGETVAVLQSLADQLAISIENAGLFAQTQTTLAETSRLYQASRQISEAATSLEVYKVLVEFAQQSQQIDAAQIVIPDAEYPEFLTSPVWWSRFPLTKPLKTQFITRSDYLDVYLGHNEILIIPDVLADKKIDTAVHEQIEQFGIRTAAFIPLHAESKWVGTLTVYRTDVSPFEPQELQSFRTLADQAAVILANQRLFEEIKQANDQLRQLDQLKTQFLANMSHELRTPLNSIIGFSRVILKGIDGPITSEQEEDLTSIHSNGQHLLSLINEILDMAKIEAGKMALTFEMVAIEPSARTAFTSIRTLLKPEVDLIWEVEPDLPPIEADAIRLRQILTNLLSNAAKYTDEGHVRLQINRDGDEYIHFAVHDTGIGIAPEEFEVLFRAFEQVDNSTTRKVGGTGLGLPITKWMINMHQGDIWVESEVGKGTAMHVRLPLRLERQTAPEITFTEAQTI
jgi:signal transduction histidine kinase